MRPEVAVAELPLGIALPIQIAQRPHRLHRRRLVQVIEQRRGAREALVADQLLGVQRAVGLAEDGVPLVRDLAQLVVDGHD